MVGLVGEGGTDRAVGREGYWVIVRIGSEYVSKEGSE